MRPCWSDARDPHRDCDVNGSCPGTGASYGVRGSSKTQEVSTVVKPIPDQYPRVMPYLIVDGAPAAIDFYTSVFGVIERMRMPGPDGRLGHAELEMGDSVIMLADENPEMGIHGPK